MFVFGAARESYHVYRRAEKFCMLFISLVHIQLNGSTGSLPVDALVQYRGPACVSSTTLILSTIVVCIYISVIIAIFIDVIQAKLRMCPVDTL